MEYSSDELEPPKWLNQSFLTEIIKSSEGDKQVKLIDFTVAPAVTKGNHFASIMFRSTTKYSIKGGKIKNESFIIKAMPEEDGFKKDMLEGSSAFDTELHMYSETLPYFQNEFKKYSIDTVFGASMLYHIKENPTVIVLKDLKALEYSLHENGWLPFDDYKLALNKLAKWHAVSLKINSEENFNIVQYYKNRSFIQDIDLEKFDFFQDGMQAFETLLRDIPDFHEYVEKYCNVKNIIFEECRKCVSYTNSKLNVLNHGDFHMKNILFKRDDSGKATDVLFVDFQFCVWGSAAIDIIYSMYMMIDFETRSQRRNEIINYYYICLIDTLKKLNYKRDIPKFEDLQIEILKMKKFELLLITSITPYIYQMASGVKMDSNDLLANENIKKLAYKNPKYINDLKQILPSYADQGYFYAYDNNNNNQSKD